MSEKKALYISRKGPRYYEATNGSATMMIGQPDQHPDAFSPVDLFRLALAGCAAMSSDQTLAHQLGNDDLAIFAGVDSVKDEENDRLSSIAVEIVTSMAGLDDAQRQEVIDKAMAAIEKYCTVKHTLDGDLQYSVSVVDEDE